MRTRNDHQLSVSPNPKVCDSVGKTLAHLFINPDVPTFVSVTCASNEFIPVKFWIQTAIYLANDDSCMVLPKSP